MGSIFSQFLHNNKVGKYVPSPLELAIEEQFPSYYVRGVEITVSDIEVTKSSWALIMSGVDTNPFLEAKKNPNFQYSSLLTWFFDSFYERFFVLSPEARPMFAHISISAQGRLLAGVISSALGLLRNKDQLHSRLAAMTLKHSLKGVKASQYGTMGAALIWAMELVLGDLFTDEVSTAWIRVYSLLLSVIVPIAVKYEFGQRSGRSISQDAQSKMSEGGMAIRSAIEHQLRRGKSRESSQNTGKSLRCMTSKSVSGRITDSGITKVNTTDHSWAKAQSSSQLQPHHNGCVQNDDLQEEDFES